MSLEDQVLDKIIADAEREAARLFPGHASDNQENALYGEFMAGARFMARLLTEPISDAGHTVADGLQYDREIARAVEGTV